ncbi:dipeptidase [Parasphingopyxis lamellibrachiae]|uniref:Membrane dipeptidase n=1 Tax=Parasphingopyxis lamellibrachiae TaxID=680125 RepID=A0A3D9FI36_9SPHN|nr:dipeptidase [Parasphingopyxis lamellibrachiae]RED17450.1 membrane dipeptidase [Parasphingopyxis lamellibrachiae]
MRGFGIGLGGIALAMGAVSAPLPAQEAASNIQEPAAVHNRLLTLDTHLDTPLHMMRPGWDIAERHDYITDNSQVDVPRMIEGGLDGGFFVIWTPQGELTEQGYAGAAAMAEARQQSILAMIAANPETVERADRADDAARIAATGRRFVYQSIENSYPLGEDIGALQRFYDNGVRMVGPVHSSTNQFADSATGEERWGGLSPLGRELVAEMNRLGIIVDGSHASDAAFDQMLELSATPIILSHSGPKTAFDHPRNLDDARIARLAETGGVISVNSIYLAPRGSSPEWEAIGARFMEMFAEDPEVQAAYVRDLRALEAVTPREDSDFEMYMASLLHLIAVAGVDHVGFGADWDGGGGVEGMRDITALPRVTARLLAAGHSEEDLAKMWSGNVLRLLRTAETHSAALVD